LHDEAIPTREKTCSTVAEVAGMLNRLENNGLRRAYIYNNDIRLLVSMIAIQIDGSNISIGNKDAQGYPEKSG
jgi:hypothetical protein